MKRSAKSVCAAVSLMALTAIVACSGEGIFSGNSSGKSRGTSGNGVPNLAGDQDSLSLIQSLSAEDSANAPRECLSILLQSPQDIEWRKIDVTDKSDIKQFYCSLDETTLSHVLFDKVQKSSTSGTDVGIGVELPKLFGSEKYDLNLKHTSGDAYTKEMARQDASTFKKHLCTSSENSQDHEFAEQTFRKYASPVTLDKFNQCVSMRQHGFNCELSESSEGVAAVLRWEPSELVRKRLPRVKLDFVTTDNLVLASKNVPQVLGIGTGQAVSFRREDPSKSSTLQVVAHDAGNAVSLACSRVLPPAKSGLKIWAQHPSCGPMILKTRDTFEMVEDEDKSRPEEVLERGAVRTERPQGHATCGGPAPRAVGIELCKEKGWDYVSQITISKECMLRKYPLPAWSESHNITSICKDKDRKVIKYPHKIMVRKKSGTETREVMPACEVDADLIGVQAISAEIAIMINDVSNYDAK